MFRQGQNSYLAGTEQLSHRGRTVIPQRGAGQVLGSTTGLLRFCTTRKEGKKYEAER